MTPPPGAFLPTYSTGSSAVSSLPATCSTVVSSVRATSSASVSTGQPTFEACSDLLIEIRQRAPSTDCLKSFGRISTEIYSVMT